MSSPSSPAIEIYSTCPASSDVPREGYCERVAEIARWSDDQGCRGILVYTDNRLVDPWLAAQVIVQSTRSLSPLVAVQPVYMHPYAVAKMAASFAHLYRRRICLNMLAGGFKNDLLALGDTTPHDRRYDRVVEYVEIVMGLLRGESVTLRGEFYQVEKLKLSPAVPPGLLPEVLLSGSSEAGRAAGRRIGATAVEYPAPPNEPTEEIERSGKTGIRVGIIARDDSADAWRIAHQRFPPDRRGQIAHELAMKVSDSSWHTQLSEMDGDGGNEQSPYWLFPFKNYKTFCPYLVGTYERVADELARYMALGHSVFILDIPTREDDLQHARKALELARARTA